MPLRRRQNAGELILREAAAGSTNAQTTLAARRADGVTDDDLRGWWSLSDRKRKKIAKEMRWGAFLVYLNRKHAGDTDDEAAGYLVRHFPAFGSAEEVASGPGSSPFVGDDRPLAEELWPRVVAQFDSLFIEDVRGYSTANALIRSELRLGGTEHDGG